MATEIEMRHPRGLQTTAYQGFSWTSLFLGGFPALSRGDTTGFLIWAGIALALTLITMGIGLPFLWIIWAAIYNNWHFERLVMQGYDKAPNFPPLPRGHHG